MCIRPNMENNPVLFEDEYVTQQLLSASIVEAAQVCLRGQSILVPIVSPTQLKVVHRAVVGRTLLR